MKDRLVLLVLGKTRSWKSNSINTLLLAVWFVWFGSFFWSVAVSDDPDRAQFEGALLTFYTWLFFSLKRTKSEGNAADRVSRAVLADLEATIASDLALKTMIERQRHEITDEITSVKREVVRHRELLRETPNPLVSAKALRALSVENWPKYISSSPPFVAPSFQSAKTRRTNVQNARKAQKQDLKTAKVYFYFEVTGMCLALSLTLFGAEIHDFLH
ncbi:hypothetical protein [Thioclava sp. GXIMD4216]|uniref:hypothetical protein n=1 Tax=Thioclava sp. GXIMD4216 TaxID=3131929 RepID=UPI0030D3A98F